MEQRLWQTLNITNEAVHYSDGKAVGLLGIQGLLVGIALAFIKSSESSAVSTPLTATLFAAGTISLAASAAFAVICLTPRLKNGGPVSPMYFGSIAANFKDRKDYAKFISENFATDEAICGEISEQILTNAKIAQSKFKWVSWSAKAFGLGLALWAILIVVILLS